MPEKSRIYRKQRQLEKLSSEKKFLERVVSRSARRGKLFARGNTTAVLGARVLKGQRVIKVCRNEIDAVREFFAARELRRIFQSALKAGAIKPKNYSLSFSRISIMKGRALVVKEEPGILLYSLLFEKRASSIDFLSKKNISAEQVSAALEELQGDLKKVFSKFRHFLDTENGNNIILKGKNKDGKLELVLIDQPKGL